MRTLFRLGLGALLAILPLQLPVPAWADDGARLNLDIRLESGSVTVGDIWRNAGPKATTAIGPAPPPGRTITIEAAQLSYIARLYDVPWQTTSGVERTTITRNGRPLARDEIMEPLRRSLAESGLPDSVSIELSNYSPVLVPPLAFPLITVDGMSFDPSSNRFAANLDISAEGMPNTVLRVAGRAVQMTAAVVATRRLTPDDVIVESDLRAVQLPERQLRGDALRSPAQAIGQAVRHIVPAGQPLMSGDVGAPTMIAKGATVVVEIKSPGITIDAQGLALAAGGKDDVIQVMNPLSRAVIAARVTGPGRAIVAPGSSPVVAASRPQRSPEITQ